MLDWTLVRAPHVKAALEEYDRLGAKDFVARYGSRRSRLYTLWHHGNEYDPPAVLGAACLRATGRAPTPEDLAGGEHEAAKVLNDLGFDVVALEQPVATRPRAAAAPPRKRAAKPVAAPRLCPRCHVAVPASGICDFCD
jgi:hypothetical protein